MTLFTSPGSRAQIIEWYAAELGVALHSRAVPLDRATNAGYLAVHPFGKLPAALAADGETPIFESGAILLYMADAFGGASTPEARAGGAKWVLWANASLWPAVEHTRKAPPAMCAGLEAVLSKQPFLAGPTFGVSDVAVGAYLFYATAFFGEKYSAYPSIRTYVAGLRARPAFAATVGAG
jgi:glutathione S-transferase